MPTNEGIKYKGGVELANNKSLESVIDKMLKEARADTAKQIFAEIESIKDEYGNPLLDTVYGKDKQYAKLKKKYKVD